LDRFCTFWWKNGKNNRGKPNMEKFLSLFFHTCFLVIFIVQKPNKPRLTISHSDFEILFALLLQI